MPKCFSINISPWLTWLRCFIRTNFNENDESVIYLDIWYDLWNFSFYFIWNETKLCCRYKRLFYCDIIICKLVRHEILNFFYRIKEIPNVFFYLAYNFCFKSLMPPVYQSQTICIWVERELVYNKLVLLNNNCLWQNKESSFGHSYCWKVAIHDFGRCFSHSFEKKIHFTELPDWLTGTFLQKVIKITSVK